MSYLIYNTVLLIRYINYIIFIINFAPAKSVKKRENLKILTLNFESRKKNYFINEQIFQNLNGIIPCQYLTYL